MDLCKGCGNNFEKKAKSQRFCSVDCRSNFHTKNRNYKVYQENRDAAKRADDIYRQKVSVIFNSLHFGLDKLEELLKDRKVKRVRYSRMTRTQKGDLNGL